MTYAIDLGNGENTLVSHTATTASQAHYDVEHKGIVKTSRRNTSFVKTIKDLPCVYKDLTSMDKVLSSTVTFLVKLL